ncbi:efflux RND transporter permease subunit [Denitratisoma oestradiolicum]|uniref:Cation efflux system protein CzcA n=1 Tax=Denitratisoma oestradiolicum TaxID=311182 RepID=A0A6S6YD95_9PROT|nr:CusA/CzcA family heavy metal efflux RND transporter [Denitratisoma oestradiolicum]TWO81726.1 CusA/CzcA family heavy metal efflux RND transporter [Denitratisoma oestradiolicum]CAB1370676.1 Cation efflux system protein CzcA [Denitratisoma oestradiolicum]
MLSRLVEFSLRQRLLVLVIMVLLMGGGAAALRQLPIDAYPDVSSTQVKIIIKSPGMTPEEVETRIVTPIELEMLGIPDKRMVRSVSKYAIADITLDFQDGTDIYWARQQVSERLAGLMTELPAGTSGGMAPITTPLGEMLMFTIEGELPLAEKRSLLDWVIRPQLRTLPGVAEINSLGGQVRSFEVVPDLMALKARGLNLADLRQALEANNRNEGAGRLAEGEESLLVRIEGSVKTLADIAEIVVASRDGSVVRVGDVARVHIGSLSRYGFVTHGGREEAVEGLVLGLRGANAQQVVGGVKARLAEIQKTLPDGVTTRIFYDRGALVERAVGTVSRALGEAIVLVLVLLLAFLGGLRPALVVATVLPMAALITFAMMHLFGMSANLMSLGGLAIAIGMLVDGAVVVVENVESELARSGQESLPLLHRIYRAVREVTLPVASGMVIIVIVFLPLLTLQGLEGKLFTPVALTIVFALSASLLLSLTVIPVLASLLLKPDPQHQEPWLPKKLTALYAPLLDHALAHARWVMITALILLGLTGGAFLLLGKTFMPTMDEGDLLMQVVKLPSIDLNTSAHMDLAMQKTLLAEVPEIRDIVARTGSDELGLDPMGLNETDSFLVLKPREQWRQPDKEWLMEEIRRVMAGFPGIDISFTQPIEMRVSEMLTGTRGDLAVKIYGSDLGELNALAERMAALLKNIRGAQDVLTVKNEGVQYYTVEVDRLAAGRLGFSVAEIANVLRTQVEGQPAGLVLEGNRRTPLIIRGGEEVRLSPALFANTQLPLPGGGSVALSSLAQLKRVAGPVKVDHENAQRMVVIQANVGGRDLVGFVEEAKLKMAAQIPLPAGYAVAWGGQFENQQRAARRLALVVPVALALIFLILFATFRSLRQAALVFANIPFAMIGGVFALLLAGEYLSVPASVGFIALLGIAVLNGLVMISHFNQLLNQGLPMARVVAEGARRRLRPVLMTASIAALGLVPLLFASGPGSEVQKPLAIVVIGGLVTSTALTLFMLPILFRRYGVETK